MDHIAIMNKSWHLIPKIVRGQKTIESRWYQTRRAPWDVVHAEDIIYFKNSGEPVTARAKVAKVLQFFLKDRRCAQMIVKKYGKRIGFTSLGSLVRKKTPAYCILVFLKNAEVVARPFHINKFGFGMSTAWLVVKNIKKIKVQT